MSRKQDAERAEGTRATRIAKRLLRREAVFDDVDGSGEGADPGPISQVRSLTVSQILVRQERSTWSFDNPQFVSIIALEVFYALWLIFNDATACYCTLVLQCPDTCPHDGSWTFSSSHRLQTR